jgi:hypothetical protein
MKSNLPLKILSVSKNIDNKKNILNKQLNKIIIKKSTTFPKKLHNMTKTLSKKSFKYKRLGKRVNKKRIIKKLKSSRFQIIAFDKALEKIYLGICHVVQIKLSSFSKYLIMVENFARNNPNFITFCFPMAVQSLTLLEHLKCYKIAKEFICTESLLQHIGQTYKLTPLDYKDCLNDLNAPLNVFDLPLGLIDGLNFKEVPIIDLKQFDQVNKLSDDIFVLDEKQKIISGKIIDQHFLSLKDRDAIFDSLIYSLRTLKPLGYIRKRNEQFFSYSPFCQGELYEFLCRVMERKLLNSKNYFIINN